MTFRHSRTLFRDDFGKGIHFCIKAGDERNELEELIEHGGGLVCDEPTEYSMTLVPPDLEVSKEEVYSYDYIKQCCEKNKLLDITPYRLNKESEYPEDFNPNAVLLKYTTWTDALQGKPYDILELYLKRDSVSNSSSSPDETSLSTEQDCSARNERKWKRLAVVESSDSEFCDEECTKKLRVERKEEKTLCSKDNGESSVGKRSKVAETSAKSDKTICSRKRTITSDSEESECDSRPPRKVVKPNSRHHGETIVSDSDESDPNFKAACLRASRNTLKLTRREYTGSERKRIIQYIVKKKAYGSVKGRELWQTMEKKKVCPGRTWQSLKEHFIKKILPRIDSFGLPEEEVRNFRLQKQNKHSAKYSSESDDTDSLKSVPCIKSTPKRREYTKDEKMKIIKYIIRCNAYGHVKGREFWQKMEVSKVCPGRTWQSLKEHYTKQILPKIESFGLSDDIVCRLKRVYAK